MLLSDTRLDLVATEERAAALGAPEDTAAWQSLDEAELAARNQLDGYWVLADDIGDPAWALSYLVSGVPYLPVWNGTPMACGAIATSGGCSVLRSRLRPLPCWWLRSCLGCGSARRRGLRWLLLL